MSGPLSCTFCGSRKNVWWHTGYCIRCMNWLSNPGRSKG